MNLFPFFSLISIFALAQGFTIELIEPSRGSACYFDEDCLITWNIINNHQILVPSPLIVDIHLYYGHTNDNRPVHRIAHNLNISHLDTISFRVPWRACGSDLYLVVMDVVGSDYQAYSEPFYLEDHKGDRALLP